MPILGLSVSVSWHASPDFPNGKKGLAVSWLAEGFLQITATLHTDGDRLALLLLPEGRHWNVTQSSENGNGVFTDCWSTLSEANHRTMELYPGLCSEHNRQLTNIYWKYSISSLKCYPDVTGLSRLHQFWPSFSLDAGLKCPKPNPLSNISE